MPAVEVFEEHAESDRARPIDKATPLPFFLHNILGIGPRAGHKLRVPLAIGDDGSDRLRHRDPGGRARCT